MAMNTTIHTAEGTGKATRTVEIVATALLLTLALVVPTPASAASSSVSVSAFVQARAAVTIEAKPSAFVVSESDIVRGYVDLPNASRVRVRTNSPTGYLLSLEIDSECVTGVVLNGAGDQIQISGGGGLVPRPYPGTAAVVADLGYRFLLSPDAKAGSYPWPVALSAMPR